MPTDESGVDRQRAADVLAEARKHVELSLLVDLVDARYRERTEARRRWRVGNLVGIASVGVAILGVVASVGLMLRGELQTVQREIEGSRYAAERRAVADISPTEDFEYQVRLGTPLVVTLLSEENARIEIAASPGVYQIDAEAITDDFDPIIYLHRHNQAGAVEEVAFNDDRATGDLNARLNENLEGDWTYYLEARDFVGLPGSFRLTLTFPPETTTSQN